MVVRGVLGVGVQASGGVGVGETWSSLLVHLVVVGSLGFVVGFRLPLVMVCLFVALTPSVPSEGRGCCLLWVRGAIDGDFKVVYVCVLWDSFGTPFWDSVI